MGRGQPENHPADHFLRASVNFRTLLMSISKFQAALTSHSYGISLLLLVCTLDTFQIMNSNGFSIQVCPSCRFDKMVEPFGECLARQQLSTFDLISEFTHFNLVIRLSKVKQLAFFSILTCRSALC